MAHVQYQPQRKTWRVVWKDAGTRKSRTFRDQSEADAFFAEFPEPPARTPGAPRPAGTRRGRLGRKPRTRAEMVAFMATKFELEDSGCWTWTGNLSHDGYGQVNWSRGSGLKPQHHAHRVILAAIGMPVPDDMVVDHLCRNRACCNPDHLEVVTQRENVMRSPVARGALNAAKTQCPKGHPYDETNTYWFEGKGFRGRQCKACQHDYYLKRRAVA